MRGLLLRAIRWFFLLTGRSDVVSLLEKAGLSSHIPGIEKRVVAERGYGAPLFLPIVEISAKLLKINRSTLQQSSHNL